MGPETDLNKQTKNLKLTTYEKETSHQRPKRRRKTHEKTQEHTLRKNDPRQKTYEKTQEHTPRKKDPRQKTHEQKPTNQTRGRMTRAGKPTNKNPQTKPEEEGPAPEKKPKRGTGTQNKNPQTKPEEEGPARRASACVYIRRIRRFTYQADEPTASVPDPCRRGSSCLRQICQPNPQLGLR